ncbi:hypothetical protein F4Z99_00765 [Candidatus Poribacteria bacterium]|nr:hypothetical protein [Candidatus Poribacteria bacterium]MYB02553.1 hypothetical protein [Candidatus Poribacteria bacterium]
MKTLSAFGLIILVFIGCTSVEYQQRQNEGEQLRAAYEEARIKNDRGSVKNRVADEVLGTWQFLGIEVLESDLSNEIESVSIALDELSRKNLTIRFFEQNGMRFYEGNNGSIRVTGKFSIYVERIAEVLYPELGMNQSSGITPEEFLFNRPGVFGGLPGTSDVLISVQGNQLHLTLGAGVSPSPTPDGWVQSDGIRYSFKRIK